MRLSFEQAYEAVFDEEQYRALLQQIADRIGATGCASGWTTSVHVEGLFTFPEEWQAGMIARYFEAFAAKDPWMLAVTGHPARGVFHNLSDLMPDAAFERSELRNELLRPFGHDTAYGAGMAVALPEGGMGGITFYRDAFQSVFDGDDLGILKTIGPDLDRLIALKASMHCRAIACTNWRNVADRVAAPVFVLTAAMKLVETNAAGETLLEGGQGLLIRSGRLCAALPAKQAELEAVCLAVLHGGLDEVNAFSISCSDTMQRFTVMGAPNPGGGRRIVLLGDSARRPSEETGTGLRLRYRLSPAETQLMLSLAAGETRNEIAERRGVSVETLRTQYRSAMAKMDCRSLTEAIIAVRCLVPVSY